MDTSAYLVGSIVHEGAFSHVMYGKHKDTEQEVAIKVFPKVKLKPHEIASIRQEQQLLHRFRESKHVVKIFASFHDEHHLYIVMEWAYTNLEHVIGLRHQFSKDEWKTISVHISTSLLAALEYLHSEEIIHGDVKPANVLMRRDKSICLGDFGSAHNLASPKDVVHGTATYAAPEVLRAQSLTTSADLWSFGCCLYAMFCGQSPFQDESESLIVQKVLNNRDIYISEIEDFWGTVILSVLQQSPEDRKSASELLEVFDEKAANNDIEGVNWEALAYHVEYSELKDGEAGWMVFESV